MLWWVTAAFAQQLPAMDANLYRVPVDSRATLWTDDSGTTPLGSPMARLYLTYLKSPLGADQVGGDGRVMIVDDVFGVGVAAGIGLDRLRFGVDVPTYPFVSSDLTDGGGSGIGDLAFDLKGKLVDEKDAGVGVGLDLRVTAPTGNIGGLGTDGPSVLLSGIVDTELDDGTVLAGNLGVKVAQKLEIPNLITNDQFIFRAGVGHPFGEDTGLSLDLSGSGYLGASGTGFPLEVLGGGWARVADSIVLRGGVGTGLTTGIGAATARVIFMLSYEPPIRDDDPDHDGILGKLDTCPNEPEDVDTFEDVDGCPDVDNDGDGILDAADKCPLVAEDQDTWQDEDGCPDPKTRVRVAVLDETGTHIAGASAHVEGEKDSFDGGDGLEVDVDPGLFQLFGKAAGFTANAVDFTVPEGARFDITVQLKAEVKLSALTVSVHDVDGKPVDASSWALDTSTASPLTDGRAQASLVPGSHKVLLAAPGYVPQVVEIDAKPGGTIDIERVLLRAKGQVHVIVVSSDDVPVEAAWTTDGETGGTLVGGLGDLSLPVGHRVLRFTADGYRQATGEVDVPAEGTGTLTVKLEASKVAVSRERIDIKGTIYFETGKTAIKPESFGLLDEIASVLVAHPEITKVSIEGHTDSRGSTSGNQTLSEGRAASVRTYLQAQGVDAARMVSAGFGESKPVDPAENEEAWAKNRRVEFLIVSRADDAAQP